MLLKNHTSEKNLLIIHHSLVDVHFEYLGLADHLLSLASGTSVLLAHHLAGALTVGASRLNLLGHTRLQLSIDHFNAVAPTSPARVRRTLCTANAELQKKSEDFNLKKKVLFCYITEAMQCEYSHPLHTLHIAFLLSCSFDVFPLYMSSSVTLKQKRFQVMYAR